MSKFELKLQFEHTNIGIKWVLREIPIMRLLWFESQVSR